MRGRAEVEDWPEEYFFKFDNHVFEVEDWPDFYDHLIISKVIQLKY